MGAPLHPARADAPRIAFLGAYPPRRCGTAAHTRGLRAAIVEARPGTSGPVIAVTELADPQRYPVEVRAEIERERVADYARGAAVVRASSLDALLLQHAAGVFGGPAGAFVLQIAENAGARVVTTLHGLVPEPDEGSRRVVARLARASALIVVTSDVGRRLLREDYDVDVAHMRIIARDAPRAGADYASILDELRARRPRPSTAPAPPVSGDSRDLRQLTDATGVRPDTADRPDARHGYRLDDNAGALALCALAGGSALDAELRGLRGRYLSFVDGAFDHRRGWFRGVMDLEHRWLGARGSDACQSRALWCLGLCASRFDEEPLRDWADALFRRAARGRPLTRRLRASALALAGAAAHLERGDEAPEALLLRDVHLDVLLGGFARNAEPGWAWFEPGLGRVNASLTRAVIDGGRSAGSARAITVGLCALEWLLGVQRDKQGRFTPGAGRAGRAGVAGLRTTPSGHLSVEAGEAVCACVAAYRAIPDLAWLDRARWAFSWFGEAGPGGADAGGARSTLAYLTAAHELRAGNALSQRGATGRA